MFVKPAPGARVRYPAPAHTHILSAEGAEVEDSPYWQRRLRDRDVVKATPPPAAAAPAAPAPPAAPIPAAPAPAPAAAV